jgi:hypothetical protein
MFFQQHLRHRNTIYIYIHKQKHQQFSARAEYNTLNTNGSQDDHERPLKLGHAL